MFTEVAAHFGSITRGVLCNGRDKQKQEFNPQLSKTEVNKGEFPLSFIVVNHVFL